MTVLTPAQIEAYVDATAAALDLPLAPEHRPGVLQFFALAASMAALTEAVDLSPHDESAVHFSPIEPMADKAEA